MLDTHSALSYIPDLDRAALLSSGLSYPQTKEKRALLSPTKLCPSQDSLENMSVIAPGKG